MIRAVYTNRKGASCIRSIHNIEDAEKILNGGYGAQEVQLLTDDNEIIGERVYEPTMFDDGRCKWWWVFDTEYFSK